jgi:protein-histidine N-methyltransferase
MKPGPFEAEGEFEISPNIVQEFLASMDSFKVKLSFFSGAWSPEFVQMVDQDVSSMARLTVVGAETIYSPAALNSFAETLMTLLKKGDSVEKTALIAAKKVYFGVGGSMEDFCDIVRSKGGVVEQIREESDGVRRAVVEVKIPP